MVIRAERQPDLLSTRRTRTWIMIVDDDFDAVKPRSSRSILPRFVWHGLEVGITGRSSHAIEAGLSLCTFLAIIAFIKKN